MDKESDIIRRVVEADTDDFAALLALAELDPKEDLCGLDLSGLSLKGADLRGADLSETDLSNANLRGTHLDGANLCGANLTGADLTDAYLSGARMTNAVVSQQQIASAHGNTATTLPDALTYPAHWLDDPGKRVDAHGMRTLDEYRSTYSELRQMIDDLCPILTMEQLRIRPNAKTAYKLLCELGERVSRHLAEEDRSLYPNLLIHENPKVKSIAWGFISGEQPLRQTFDDYHTRWLKNCDFDFSDDFIAETREVFDMVARRIEREEQVLLPKLVEIGMFDAIPAGPAKNLTITVGKGPGVGVQSGEAVGTHRKAKTVPD